MGRKECVLGSRKTQTPKSSPISGPGPPCSPKKVLEPPPAWCPCPVLSPHQAHHTDFHGPSPSCCGERTQTQWDTEAWREGPRHRAARATGWGTAWWPRSRLTDVGALGSHPTPSSVNPLGCCCGQTLYCVWDLSIPHERPQSMDLIWLFLAGNLTQKPWQICRKLVIRAPNERVNLSPHKSLPEASARARGPALSALVGRRRNTLCPEGFRNQS